MNKGFIVGKVRLAGRSVEGVTVTISSLNTNLVCSDISRYSTDKNGRFVVLFTWSGTDFDTAIDKPTIGLVASKDYESRQSYETRYVSDMGRGTARGFLMRDVIGLTLVSLNDIVAAVQTADVPGILDFTQDFILTYRKASVYPFFKTGALSTENWLLLGGANIELKTAR